MDYRVPRFTRAGSLSVEEAGGLMRLSHARLVETKAGIRAWRVAGAVWGLTVPYSKGWEAVFIGRLTGLTGMDERAVRRGIKECAAAGALQWEPNRWIPPKGEPGRPSLIGLPGAAKRVSKPSETGSSGPGDGSSAPGLGAAKTGSSGPYSLGIDVEPYSSTLDTDTGTCRSSGIGHQAPESSVESSEAGQPHGEADGQAPAPEPEPLSPAEVESFWSDLEGPAAAERFPPFHGDERTGEGIGDDERSQMEWRAANPRKVRARKRRDE